MDATAAPAATANVTADEKRLRSAIIAATSSTFTPQHRGANVTGKPPKNSVVAEEGLLQVEGGRIWFRSVGTGSGTPLIVIHGLGVSSAYLAGLEDLGDQRRVVFYDQLGCGRSDRPSDSSLWNVERFLLELRQVCSALSLQEVHLIGHSWGGLLALEHALDQPRGLCSLVLANTPVSIPRYVSAMGRLRVAMESGIQATLARHEREGTTNAQEYLAAIFEYNRRYLCRLEPWPRVLNEAFANIGIEPFSTLWGPDVFHATGVLQGYDRTDRLSELRIPVLYTTGGHCPVTPQDALLYSRETPGSRLRVFEETAHMTPLEDPRGFTEAVQDFLDYVDTGLSVTLPA